MALFSIITVCFNSGETIEKTLKSVLAQEFKDYEYIIVDGGSRDNTLEILKKYEELFEGRLKWLSEPDKGIYDAFNKGCRRAKGEFLWLVNSDDAIEPNALCKLEEIAKRNVGKCCILTAKMNFHNNNGTIITSTTLKQEGIQKAAKEYHMGISHPASIYSKKVYEEVGFYDDRYYISGDIDHFIRCVRSNKVEFIPVDEVITNMYAGGISTTFNIKKVNHDWNIRYKKFCNSKFDYIKHMYKENYSYLKKYIKSTIIRKR